MLLYQLSQDQKIAFLKLARKVVFSDKNLEDKERLSIIRICHEMGISTVNTVDRIDIDYLPTLFDTKQVRVLIMIELINIAISDGNLCVSEHEVINGIRKSLGFTLGEFLSYTKAAKNYTLLLKEIQTLMET